MADGFVGERMKLRYLIVKKSPQVVLEGPTLQFYNEELDMWEDVETVTLAHGECDHIRSEQQDENGYYPCINTGCTYVRQQ